MLTRILAGCAIFAVLAIVDYRRNGPGARRWREYLFLVSCVAVALLYGIINDQLTVGISWEYFYYGKELYQSLGQKTPPDQWALRWEAAKVGMKATWSAGLILGVILLLANNPTKSRAPLPFSRMYRLLPILILFPAVTAAILGGIGYVGGLSRLGSDFPMLIEQNLWRPYRFMAVFGIHLGGYAGSLLGAIAAGVLIQRERA